MKLSLVTEADATRRDFLKKTGGGLLSTLVSGGISIDAAKQLVNPATANNFSVLMSAGESGRYQPDVSESWNSVKKMFARISSFTKSPVNMMNMDGESLELSSSISAPEIAKLIKKFGVDYDDTEDGRVNIYINLPGQEIRIVDNRVIDYYDKAPINRENLMSTWWERWEQFGTEYLSKGMATILKKTGIDPASRVNIEGPYYNYDPEEWEPGYDEIKAEWEREDREREEEIDRERDEEIIPRPDDYLASPMHQPFESKLDKALGLTETQKFAGIMGSL